MSIALTCFAVASGAIYAAWATRGVKLRIVMSVVAVLSLLPTVVLLSAIHPELIDSRFRIYKAFYRELRIGMTRDEVFSAMIQHYPKDGRRQRPKIMRDTPGSIGFFMDPEESDDPNCEGIFLEMVNGRVARLTYSPD